MRYLATFLSVFLLVLSVNVFAQTNDVPEINTENIQEAEDEILVPNSTIDSLSDVEKSKVFSCTNEFTNLSIDVNADYSEFVSGTVMKLSGEVQNDSDRAILNGTLYIKVLNTSNNEYDFSVIDHFVVQEDISIPAKSSIPIAFDWNIPSTAPTGNYKIAAYVYVDNKYDVAGVSSSKVMSGGSFDFTLSGEEQGGVYFDESTIKINGKNYEGLSPVVVQNSGDVLFSVDVDNKSTLDQNTRIKWKLYKGDSKNPENLISTINSDTTVFADSSETIQFEFSDNKFPLYYVVGELSYGDSKSIIEIQYIREGTNAVKIFSSGVEVYPLVRGDNNIISTCVSNIGSNTTIQNGKILVELKNSRGKVVESHEYKGPITVEVMGVKKDFKASQNLNSFSLHTSVWIDDTLIDESVVKYDCNILNAGNCKTSILVDILYPLGGFLLIILLLVAAIKINRNKSTPLALLLLLISAALFVNPSSIEAKSVTSSASVTSLSSGGYPNILFTNVNLSVAYNAELRYVSNNALVSDSATILVGTQLKVVTSNNAPSHSGSNSQYSTYPTNFYSYGSWVSNAGPPSAADACDGQYYRTYTNNLSGLFVDGWSVDTNKFYIHPTVNPPAKTITTSGNLSCGSFNSSGVAICTVNGTGALRITVNYPGTSANFYHARHQKVSASAGFTQQTDQCTPSTWSFSPKPTNLAARTIVFNVSGIPVVPANAAPNAPVIGGSKTGYPNTTYTFSFDGTDPDGDQVRYGVDWDNNNTVDEYLPASGYVNSGTARNGTKSWSTTGTKTFKARTYDVAGLFSGWTSYTITLSNPAINGSCGTTNNSCLVGTSVDATDNAVNYVWNCNGSNGGTNDSCTLPKPVTGTCNLSVVNGCSTGTLNDTADTGLAYNWRCVGSGGGLSNSCTLPKPVNAVCGNVNNICTTGTSVDATDNATNYRWNCNGLNGGTSLTCTAPKPVNAVCGNVNNICTTGTSVDIDDNNVNYRWNCNGLNGGTSLTCTAPKPVNPQSYTLNFNGNGATSGSTASQTLASGSSAPLRANGFVRTGYSFIGWANSAGGAVAYNNQASYTMGSANDTLFAKWNANSTGPTFTVSCSASPNPVVFPTTNTTFTAVTSATSPRTFSWKNSAGTVLGSASTLIRTYGDGDNNLHTLTLDVTKGAETNSATCSVLVRCDGTHYEDKPASACNPITSTQNFYTCRASGWATVSKPCTPPVVDPIATFTFAPDIVANASGKCGLTMSATNVSSCTLVSPNGNISIPVTANSVSLVGSSWKNVPIGRYTLSCTGLGATPVTKSFGVKSCIVNPDYREN